MNTTEKLNRIRARCVELLELASKRTPGKWDYDDETGFIGTYPYGYSIVALRSDSHCKGNGSCNAVFIAATAGPFEASLKSTIAAIDHCIDSPIYYANVADDILSAWPDELLEVEE